MTNTTQTNDTSNQGSLTIAKYITKKTGLSFNDIIKQIKRGSLKLELNIETFESLTSVLTKPVSNLVNFTYIGEVYAYITNKTSEVSPPCGNLNGSTGNGSGSTGDGGTGSNPSTSPVKFTELLNNDLQYIIHSSDNSLVQMDVDNKSYVVPSNKKIESRLALSRISFYDENSESSVYYPEDPSQDKYSNGMINLVSETDNHLEIDVLINRNASHSENRTIRIEFVSLAIQEYLQANPNKYFNYLDYDLSAFSALTVDPEGFMVNNSDIDPFVKKVSNNQLGSYDNPLFILNPVISLWNEQRAIALPVELNWMYQQAYTIPSSLVGKKTSLSLKIGTKTTKINFKIVEIAKEVVDTPPIETPKIPLSYETRNRLTQFVNSLYVEPKNLDTVNEFSIRPGLYYYNLSNIKTALQNNSEGSINVLDRLTFYFNCPTQGYEDDAIDQTAIRIQDVLNKTLLDIESIALVSHELSNRIYGTGTAAYKVELLNVQLFEVIRLFNLMNWSSSNAKPNILGVELDVQGNVFEKYLTDYTDNTPVLDTSLNSTINRLFDNVTVEYDSDATDKSYIDGVEANKYDIKVKPEKLHLFASYIQPAWDWASGIAITGDSELDNYRTGADFLLSFSNGFQDAVNETKYSKDTTSLKDVQFWVSNSISRQYADANAPAVTLISMLDRTDLMVDSKNLTLSVYVCDVLFEKHIDSSMIKLKPTFNNSLKPAYQRFVDSLDLQTQALANDNLSTNIVADGAVYDELKVLALHSNTAVVPLNYLIDDIEIILNKGAIDVSDSYTRDNLFANSMGMYSSTKTLITDNTGYQIPGLENQTDSLLISKANLFTAGDSFRGSIGYFVNLNNVNLTLLGLVLTVNGNKFFKAFDQSLSDYDITPTGYLREAFKSLLSQASLFYQGEATHLDKAGNSINCHDYALMVNDPSVITNFIDFLRSKKSSVERIYLSLYNAPGVILNPNSALFVSNDLTSSDIGGNYIRQSTARYNTEPNRYYYIDKPLNYNVYNLPSVPVTTVMFANSSGSYNVPLDLDNINYLGDVILKISTTEKFTSETKVLNVGVSTTNLTTTVVAGSNIPIIEDLA